MIIRARVVVTMDGPPIENGAVVLSENQVIAVGKFSEIKNLPSPQSSPSGRGGQKDSPPNLFASPIGRGSREAAGEGNSTIIDLGDQVLLPGLINAHCHLDYTCLRGRIPRQQSFTDWIRAINAEKSNLSPEDYVASITEGFSEAQRFGTTTIVNLTGFPELVSRIKSPIRTWWFAELIDVRDPSHANEIVDGAVEQLKSGEHWGLAPHAPFTASANLYRRCEEVARRDSSLLTTHLAESGEEAEMFRNASGPLYEFLKGIGRDMSDCGNTTPIERFKEIFRDSSTPLGMTKSWMLVHLNEISLNDFDLLEKAATSFSVVHCPRSHEYFRHSPFQFQKLSDLGLNICLGTDSLGSNDDLSLFAEMRAFQKMFPDVAPEKVLEMATVNSACALGQSSVFGRIRSGFLADLIAIPIQKSKSVFEEILGFEGGVSWSLVGGRILA